MQAQSSTWADLAEGGMALAILAAGFYAYNFVSGRILAGQYPDYDRHLTYQENMFFEGEFDRIKAYAKQNDYPFWFHFIWLRDIALIFLSTLGVIVGVYLAERGIKMFTGGLIEVGGVTSFTTNAYAPLIASIFGVFVGVWITMKVSERSEHYHDFAQYVATMSRKRAVRHIEHFYRAREINGDWLKGERDLLVMIYERYTPTLPWALKITGGLTLLVFIFDIVRGL